MPPRHRNPPDGWTLPVNVAAERLAALLATLSKRQAGAFWACAFADAAAHAGAEHEVFERWLRELQTGRHDGPAGKRIYNNVLAENLRFGRTTIELAAKQLVWRGFGYSPTTVASVVRPLAEAYVARGYPPDQALGRIATCLMQVPSARGSRADVVGMAARAAWADAWARRQEERGRRLPAGADIMRLAPATPARANRWALALVEEIEARQGHPIDVVLFREVAREPFGHLDDYTPMEFGFALAMQALGHGVAWSDAHPELSFRVPSSEFYL